MKKYSDRLEEMEQSAYNEDWGSDWLEMIGENVKFYAKFCEEKGKRPTFSGFVKHLEKCFYGEKP